MVGQPCLASLLAKFHVGVGWCSQFLYGFVWSRVRDARRIWQWIRERNSECASDFVQILGKVLQKPLKWFNKASGTKAWVVHRCFNGMPGSRPVAHQLTTTNTKGEPQVAQFLKLLHEFKSSSVRIDIGPFVTLLRRWKLVMGHAKGFWRKNWACTVSQPNLCPGSWQLTRSVSVCTELRQLASDNEMLLSRVITGDESWVYGYDPETKRQSSQWKKPHVTKAKKGQTGEKQSQEHDHHFLWHQGDCA